MDKFSVIRQKYPATQSQAYLDTSTTGLFSKDTYEAMKAVLDKRHMDGVSITEYWESWKEADEWRTVFAGMIGAQADEVFYGKDSSDMLNTFICGVDIPKGSNVLVPDISFPSTRNAWLNREKDGLQVRYLKNENGVVTTDQIIENMDKNTFAVSICSVEPSSGYHYEIKRLGELCRKKGIYLVVDATQSLGAMDLDVVEMQIDVMVTSTYKWLNNLFGFGVGYMRKALLDTIEPMHVGWTGVRDRMKDFTNLELVLHQGAQKFETGGLNWIGLKGLQSSVDTYMNLGKKDVETHILKLVDLLYGKMEEVKQVEIYPVLAVENRSGIVYLKLREGFTWNQDFFDERGVKLNMSGNKVRVGIHFYNNESDILALIDALKEL